MDLDKLRKIYIERAIGSYRNSDKSRWKSCLWCWKIVGNYERGATLGLADDMGVSVDTVEDMAHAYSMFVNLCNHENGLYRKLVFAARQAPYVYHSHFRALYDASRKYNLPMDRVVELFFDIVQSEGTITSRRVDEHTRSRYGAETDWTYEAQKLQKKINQFMMRPDLPQDGRGHAQKLYDWIGENA